MKLSHEQIRDAAYAGLKAKLGDQWPAGGGCNWRIVATFADAVVVQRGDTPKLERYPLEADLFGNVTLGEPEAVAQEFAKLAEAAIGARLLHPLVEEGEKAKPGSRWAVVVIAEGLSHNRTFYPATVLREAAPLYDGAKVFWNHSDGSKGSMRDPRDIAGFLRSPRVALLEAEGAGKTAIFATLHATDAGLRERLLEAHEAGNPDLFGLSHTAYAKTERVRLADGTAHRVTAIEAVESVDVVAFPSAGGRVVRLVAGLSSPVAVTDQELEIMDKKLAKLKESRPDLFARLGATPTEAEVDALMLEAITPAPKPEPPKPAPVAPPVLSDADRSLLREAAQARRERIVETALQGVNLPAAAVEELREALGEREDLTLESATEAVKAKVARVARMLEGQSGIGFGGGVSIGAGQDEAEKVLDLLDDIMMTDASDAVVKAYEGIAGRKPKRPDTHSVREAYFRATGDQRVYGRPVVRESLRPMSRFDALLSKRLVEGRRLVESVVQTSTWAEVFANTMGRRMLAEYRAFQGMNDWRLLATIVPVENFKTQSSIRVGGYGDLPGVNEAGNYTEATSPGDEQAQWAVTKRGYTEAITWEALVNDDLGVIRRIPVSMGRAAARTLYKFVTKTLLADNPTCDYDSTALFHTNHGNIITTALSSANVTAAEKKLLDQTDMSSNEKLGLTAQWIMVPTDLKETAWRLVNSPVLVQSSNFTATEPNYARDGVGLSRLIVNPYLTDANDYFIGGDKANAPIIEIGFLFGQEEPLIVIADQQGVDPYFTADKQRLKIRHVYGGDVVDHRNVVGGIVT